MKRFLIRNIEQSSNHNYCNFEHHKLTLCKLTGFHLMKANIRETERKRERIALHFIFHILLLIYGLWSNSVVSYFEFKLNG